MHRGLEDATEETADKLQILYLSDFGEAPYIVEHNQAIFVELLVNTAAITPVKIAVEAVESRVPNGKTRCQSSRVVCRLAGLLPSEKITKKNYRSGL